MYYYIEVMICIFAKWFYVLKCFVPSAFIPRHCRMIEGVAEYHSKYAIANLDRLTRPVELRLDDQEYMFHIIDQSWWPCRVFLYKYLEVVLANNVLLEYATRRNFSTMPFGHAHQESRWGDRCWDCCWY